MTQDLAVKYFEDAVSEQIDLLTTTNNLSKNAVLSKLTSFTYEVKKMLGKQDVSSLTPQSIREAFKASLDTGIPVDKRNLAYVVKYNNDLQYQVGFKGFVFKIKELFPDALIKAELVYKDDEFLLEKSEGQAKFTHKISNPFNSNEKDVIGAYAFIQFNNSSFIETIGINEINKIKSKAKTKYVWEEWFGEMAKKVVIRRLCKTLAVGNNELRVLEEYDNKNYELKRSLDIDYSEVKEMPKEIQENKADIIKEQDCVVETEIINDTKTENIADKTYIVFSVDKTEGISKKTGKTYTKCSLIFEDGTEIITFDNQDYKKGQIIKIDDYNQEKNLAKKITIIK